MSGQSFRIGRTVFQQLKKPGQKPAQTRAHHPDPFNPKVTMGWKAALKVGHNLIILSIFQ
jgi:hypothetical protein